LDDRDYARPDLSTFPAMQPHRVDRDDVLPGLVLADVDPGFARVQRTDDGIGPTSRVGQLDHGLGYVEVVITPPMGSQT
jgi:hypothetical protein